MILLSVGVFLALMGEQWREDMENRAMARASLERFRTEVAANRQSLASVAEYHSELRGSLFAYFAAEGPKTAANFDVPVQGIGPVFFEQTAWELAVATQALAHVDQELAFSLSRAYTIQRAYASQQAAIVQSTLYARSWTTDVEGFWRPVLAFLSDVVALDPVLLEAYDHVLAEIDADLGQAAARDESR